MTTRTAFQAPRAAALVLSFVMTFGVFASVTSLAVPAHHGAVLVQAEQAPRS